MEILLPGTTAPFLKDSESSTVLDFMVLFTVQDNSWTGPGDRRGPVPGERLQDPSSGAEHFCLWPERKRT